MSISELSPVALIRSPAPGPVQAVTSVERPQAVATPLEPAVRVDIRPGERPAATESARPVEGAPAADRERRVTVDTATKSLVYQVVDPASGDIVVQLPDPVVLKARAYAEAVEAKSKANERPLDRTA